MTVNQNVPTDSDGPPLQNGRFMNTFAGMEDNFYRSPSRRPRLTNRLFKVLKNPRSVLTFLIGSALVLYVLFDNKGIVKRIRLELQRKEMIEKIEAAKQETKRLEAQLKAVQGDKKTIEKIARERYGMAREGETVYRVKKN